MAAEQNLRFLKSVSALHKYVWAVINQETDMLTFSTLCFWESFEYILGDFDYTFLTTVIELHMPMVACCLSHELIK